MAKRRYFTREFKLQILEQLKSKSAAEIAKENNVHPMMIYKWKREFEVNPAKAFAGHGKICKLGSRGCKLPALGWQALCRD